MRDKLDYITWLTAALIVLPFAVFMFPQIIGFSDSYIAQSDSMAPAIKPGSVIFVNSVQPSEISQGDIITFREHRGDDVLITHRVQEVQRFDRETQFKTKGDANPEADPEWIPDYQVVGKTSLTVPRMGRIVEIANTGLGKIVVIAIPSILLILNELRNMVKTIESERRPKIAVKE